VAALIPFFPTTSDFRRHYTRSGIYYKPTKLN
jgi:hypothetical protein